MDKDATHTTANGIEIDKIENCYKCHIVKKYGKVLDDIMPNFIETFTPHRQQEEYLNGDDEINHKFSMDPHHTHNNLHKCEGGDQSRKNHFG